MKVNKLVLSLDNGERVSVETRVDSGGVLRLHTPKGLEIGSVQLFDGGMSLFITLDLAAHYAEKKAG